MRRALALVVVAALAPLPVGAVAAAPRTAALACKGSCSKPKRRAVVRRFHGPVTSPPVAPAVARLGVTAREFWLQPSRRQLTAGPVLVELNNAGEDSHNLRIEPAGGGATVATFPVTESGARSKVRVTLAPGSYKLYCTLLDHDVRGMHATLTVR